MKNLFKIYLIIWFIIALIFNVVAFATHGDIGEFYKYNAAFFVHLILVNLAFILQLLFTKYSIVTTQNTHSEPLAQLNITIKNLGFVVLQMLAAVIIVLFPVIPSIIVPIIAFAVFIANFLIITITSKKIKSVFSDFFAFLNKKIVKFVFCPSLVFLLILITVIPNVIYPTIKYNKGVTYLEQENLNAACSEFAKANGYKDSTEKLQNIIAKDDSLAIYNANIGDSVKFGRYEQDANTENGYEPIEWTVLDKKGNKVLLITSYCIENIAYNKSLTNVTWENSSLRNWLNTEFIDIAFNETEKSMLHKTYLSNNKNPKYIAPKPGKSTTDKVFILNYFEANYYLSSNELINVYTTQATQNSLSTIESDPTIGWWWLRTPGAQNTSAMTNHEQLKFSYMGYQVNHTSYTVRPCVWVEL